MLEGVNIIQSVRAEFLDVIYDVIEDNPATVFVIEPVEPGLAQIIEPAGPPGPTGEQGLKGDKGDQGEQGIQGIPGNDGADGTNGIDGTNGTDGVDGTNGIDGADGEQGIQGAPGSPASTASADGTGIAIGNGASGNTNGLAVGLNSTGTSGVAVGNGALGTFSGAALGANSTATSRGTALGENANTNSKDRAVALGNFSKAMRYRETVKSADGVAANQQLWSMVNWYGTTTTANVTELLLGATATQRCIILANSAIMFCMQIIAGVTGGGNTASWKIEGAIKRGALVGDTILVGVPTITSTGRDAGAAAWAVAVAADTVNGALILSVTGAAATTIKWNATATLSELRF